MGWGSIKKAVSKAFKDTVKEVGRAAKKVESTVRHFDSTDWWTTGTIFLSPCMAYDHNKGGIKRAMGMPDADAEDPSAFVDQNTLTNEASGAAASEEEVRRRRLGAQYSLKRTAAARTGRVLGGSRGGAGTGGHSVRNTGGSV